MNKSEEEMWSRLQEPAPEIDEYGDKYWRNKDGELHRENDMPAVIWKNGAKHWYTNGKCHRDNDMPAIIFADGDKEWWINNEFIRIEHPK